MKSLFSSKGNARNTSFLMQCLLTFSEKFVFAFFAVLCRTTFVFFEHLLEICEWCMFCMITTIYIPSNFEQS